MNQNLLVPIFFFVLLLVILYLVFLLLSPFLVAIAWAAILAIVVYPAYAYLVRLLKGRRTLAALIITILITFLIVFPAMRVSLFLSQEAVELAKTVRSYMSGDEVGTVKGMPWVEEVVRLWEAISSELAFFEIDLKKSVVQGVQLAAGFLVSEVRLVAQNIFLFTVNSSLPSLLFFSFFETARACLIESALSCPWIKSIRSTSFRISSTPF